MSVYGRYIDGDEVDKKVIVFDFSGNELYRASHISPYIDVLDKILFVYDLTCK